MKLQDGNMIHRVYARKYGEHPCLSRQELVDVRIPEGLCMLFDSEWELIEPTLLFQLEKTSRRKTVATANAYGDDLAQLCLFCEVNGYSLLSLDNAKLDAFARTLREAVSPSTGRVLAASTLHRRDRVARRLAAWLPNKRRDWHGDQLPSPDISVPSTGWSGRDYYSAYHRTKPDTRQGIPPPSGPDRTVRVLPVSAQEAIFDLLGPADPHCAASRRTRLIAETAAVAGLRVDEVCNLTLGHLRAAERQIHHLDDDWKPISFELTKTKGLRPRTAKIPLALVRDLLEYESGERARVARRAEETRNGFRVGDRLFLSLETANHRDLGNPARSRQVSSLFSQASIDAGFTIDDLAEIQDEDAGAYRAAKGRSRAKYTFHSTRHTFAVDLYVAEQKAGNTSPWLTVCNRLGHESLETTIKYYLSHLQFGEARLTDQLLSAMDGKLQVKVHPQ